MPQETHFEMMFTKFNKTIVTCNLKEKGRRESSSNQFIINYTTIVKEVCWKETVNKLGHEDSLHLSLVL